MKTHTNQLTVHPWEFGARLRGALHRFSVWNLAIILSVVCLTWGTVSLLSGNVDGPDHMSHSDALLMAAFGLACFIYTVLGERVARGGRTSATRENTTIPEERGSRAA